MLSALPTATPSSSPTAPSEQSTELPSVEPRDGTGLPTTQPTTFPTYAPLPPESPVEPLQQGVVCGPEISLVRRQLSAEADGDQQARALLQGYTPQTCYEVCTMHVYPSDSSFQSHMHININIPHTPLPLRSTGLPRPPGALAGRVCHQPVL